MYCYCGSVKKTTELSESYMMRNVFAACYAEYYCGSYAYGHVRALLVAIRIDTKFIVVFNIEKEPLNKCCYTYIELL